MSDHSDVSVSHITDRISIQFGTGAPELKYVNRFDLGLCRSDLSPALHGLQVQYVRYSQKQRIIQKDNI